MSGAFAAALVTLMNDPNLSVPGVYTAPAAAAIPVRVLRTTGTAKVAGEIFGNLGNQDTAELQVAEVPTRPRKGATLAFEGVTYTINGPASAHRNGLSWLLTLAETA